MSDKLSAFLKANGLNPEAADHGVVSMDAIHEYFANATDEEANELRAMISWPAKKRKIDVKYGPNGNG